MSNLDILKKVAAKKLTPAAADKLIAESTKVKLQNRLIETDKVLLCQFSDSGDTGSRICSWTNDPHRRGPCERCRVASDWEEVYG